jgi:hypothetical protein
LGPTEGAVLKVWTRPTPTRNEASQMYSFLNKPMNQLHKSMYSKCNIPSPAPFELNFHLRVALKVVIGDCTSIVTTKRKKAKGVWQGIY